jgi:L-arabinokinase
VPTLVFYISGHGFGHASRDIEVINALGDLAPSTRVIVRTAAPRWLFDLTVKVPHLVQHVETDTGVVQLDSLTHDLPETMRRATAFYAAFEAKVVDEAEFLWKTKATLVVGDIPPLAFAAAARAGVECFALGNFTWDWIYDAYRDDGTPMGDAVRQIRLAYSQANEAWRLPMHGGFDAFAVVVDTPFIARRSTRTPEETRQALGLPLDRKIVLSSFGGYGLPTLPLDGLDCFDEYDVVIAEASLGGLTRGAPGAVHAIVEGDLYSRGFRYEDLVSASDVVLTKPGFGIVAECLANETALVYTSRGAFREYDVLVREMPSFLRCAYISQDDLFAGRWRAALEEARLSPPPPTRPPTNGAEVVADRIVGRLA